MIIPGDQHDIPKPSVLPSTPALVQCVLSQVQAEFAEWNWDYSRQILQGLSSSREPSRPSLDALKARNALTDIVHVHTAGLGEQNWHGRGSGTPTAMQSLYSPDGQVVSETFIPFQVVDVVVVLDAHPAYESCSPSLRNAFKGDDDDNMVFIPYADDPSFDQLDHSSWYESFSWQEDFDPDRTQWKSCFWRHRIAYILDMLWNMRISKNATYCR